MEPERWRRVEALFHRAVELDPEQRAAFCAAECADDPELRALLERLIRDDAAASPAIDTPGGLLGSTPPDPLVGLTVGVFRLTARLAAGGMGVVYRARRCDGLFEQEVAVKLIRAGIATEEARRRFERERRTLAALVHPNIARLYDGGTTEHGSPYLVMELIDGLPIDRYCDERGLGIDERLRLFATTCRAVHHAHTNLIIHRDLKPANVLVDAQGVPKLLDFGIARLLAPPHEADQEPELTRTSASVMTPEYASPEQLAGGPLTTASDIYSLGVVLYGLLTGHKLFQVESASPAAWERVVGERPPRRPSTAVVHPARPDGLLGRRSPTPQEFAERCGATPSRLRRRLTGDLDRIVLMALRKEPERRYASAQELAADIERHLAGHPVLAREDSLLYRASKFVRRNRIAVTAATVVLAALVFGALAARRGERLAWQEAQHARIEADSFRDIADFLMGDFQGSLEPDAAARAEGAVARILREAASVRLRYAADRHRQANLLDGLGRVCLRLAAFEPAEALFTEAHDLRVSEFGPRSLEVALSLGSLGDLAYRRADHQAAIGHLERALHLHRSLPLGAHTSVDRAANDLAVALRAAGQLDRAATLHREALELRRAESGRSLPVAESLNNLAGIHLGRGEHDRAAELLEESLEIRRGFLGPGHPLTLQAATNLANPLWHLGEHDRARSLFEEAETGYRALRGQGEDGLAYALSALASLDLATNDLPAARVRLEEALEIRTRRLGPDHPERAALLIKVAGLRHASREDAQARGLWDEALRIHRAALGPTHPLLARSLRERGVFLIDTGAHAEAEVDLREALGILRAAPDGDRAELGRTELCLGMCLRASGRAEEAREHLRAAVELLEDSAGSAPHELELARRQLEGAG